MRIFFSIAVCMCVGLVTVAGAAEVKTARVERDGEHYRVDFAVIIHGEVDRLRNLITDYEHLDELSDTIISSRVLSGQSGANARIEVVLRPCVLMIFCKTISKISDSHVEAGAGRIRYEAVAGRGDFETARETITMKQVSIGDAPRAYFRYSAVLKPAFYIPGFIGPWLIRRAIVQDLEQTSRRVEARLGGAAR